VGTNPLKLHQTTVVHPAFKMECCCYSVFAAWPQCSFQVKCMATFLHYVKAKPDINIPWQ